MTPSRRISLGLLVLAVGIGGLDLAQRLGLGAGYRLPEVVRREPVAPLSLNRDGFELPSWGDYAIVLDRPIFNEDRKPTPVSESATPDQPASVTAKPLNATLTSVILTRDVKLAIVRNNDNGQSEVVRLGRPLSGEQNGWKLVEVSPRGATFEGEGLGRQVLELAVNERSIGAPAPGPGSPKPEVTPGNAAAVAPAPNPVPGSDAAAQARAEEIRRRIEERRRQLREEAERMRLEQTN